MATESRAVRSLLLVRNGVDHDARVLRAARVAERVLPGTALVLGVATATAPAGAAIVEGVQVLRLPARPPGLTRLFARHAERSAGRLASANGRAAGAEPARSIAAMTPAATLTCIISRNPRLLAGVRHLF